MSCLIRSGFNVKHIKQGKWMPVFKKNLDRFYSSIKKASKRKTKQNNVAEAISPETIKDKDILEKVELKQCETCHEMNVGDGSTKETADRVEKETQTPEEIVRKPYPKISDFLIRNIMSFPIHGPSRDGNVNYQTEDPNFSSFPSVTTILSETTSTESRRLLEKWKQKMITQHGSEQFLEIQKDPVRKSRSRKICKRSKKIVVATLCRGKKLHSAIKNYLLGEDMIDTEIDETVKGCWKSVKTALPHISNVKLVETFVHHPHLHYKGIVDCVACFRNVPHVIEWKQSEKAKKNLHDTYDAPIQLCAYLGTMPWCKSADFGEPITSGLVVIAYVDGSPADIFQLSPEYCQRYWEQWLRRVQQFWLMHSPELKDNFS